MYWSPNDSSLFETPVRPPSIRYPGPTRVRPQLHLNTHTNSIRPSIIAATSVGTDTSPKVSPVEQSAGAARSISSRSDISPLSRNPSLTSTLQPGTEAALTKPSAVPPVPKIPEIAVLSKAKTKHARQKSSVSSRKFLPKDWLSEPISEDPQIRALASPPASPEIDAVSPSSEGSDLKSDGPKDGALIPNIPSPPAPTASPAGRRSSDESQSAPSNGTGIQTRRRSMTAPGNPPPVLPPVPLMVRKSRTSYISPSPRSIHHPHHPNYMPPTMTPKISSEGLHKSPAAARPSLAPASKSNPKINNHRQPLQRQKSTSTSTRLPPHRQLSMGHHPHTRFPPTQPSLAAHGSIKDIQRARSSSSFRNNQFPRRTPSHNQRLQPHYQHYQNQHHYQHQHQHHNQHNMMHHAPAQTPLRPTYTRRFHSNDGRGFDPAHTLPPIPRSDDTATLYPSTRRPRSSTYGGIPNTAITSNNNSSAQEAMSARRTSLSLADGGVALDGDREIVERRNTYRGAERTSFCAPSGMALG